MGKKMKALVKSKAKEGLWLKEVPMPEIGINDVLVKILKTSICGTDVHIWNWDEWAQKTIPLGMHVGHEFVGVIQTVGSNVRDFTRGDIVSGEGHVVCGRCRNCLAGRRHLCPRTSGIGVNRPGAFAQYLSIPVTNVWAADPNIPLEVTSCFDPLGNATHTALSFDLLGEDVLITGAGPIGIMAAAIARHCRARNVVVTDVNPYRLKLAKKMGATATVDVRSQKIDAEFQASIGMKEGFDVGMEMSGNPAAFQTMISNMAHGGKIAMLGILGNTAINWDTIIFNSLTIKGIYGREMYETWYKMTMMIQCGLDIAPIITHRFDYTQFAEGFKVMRSGKSGKVMLTWAEL